MLVAAIRSLESSGAALAALVSSLSPEERDWRPTADSWSIHDIVCHLLDEERDDFRRRLRLVLENPSLDWPLIDPQGWPKSRDYAARDFPETLASWERERRESIVWLRSLDPENTELDNSHTMPWGELRAGDLLASWAAHDLLHLRQILSRRFGYHAASAEPYSTLYAGEW